MSRTQRKPYQSRLTVAIIAAIPDLLTFRTPAQIAEFLGVGDRWLRRRLRQNGIIIRRRQGAWETRWLDGNKKENGT